jgi:hypothetical protein
MSSAAPPALEGAEFLARCVSGQSGNPALEMVHEKGGDAVLALYRLVKVALIHSFENDAVGRTIDQSYGILRDFSEMAGGSASVTFVDQSIFVCGQLLRASRMVYESASELGALLERCGVSEVSLAADVARDDLAALAAATAGALRGSTALLDQKIPHITLRRVDSVLTRREREEDVPLAGRFLRLYASALVVMRRFFDGIAAGTPVLPHRVKRIAQAFITLAESGDSAGLLGLTTLANAHRDDAGRAVQSAILAIAVGRQITADRVTLARLAMAALLADVGYVRLLGPAGRDRLVKLSEDDDAAVPAIAGAISISTGGVNAQSALRTVVLYEATSLEREAELGPLYGGQMSALVQAKILYLVRNVLDRLAPRDTSRSLSVLEALQIVAHVPTIDRTLLRMLVEAVGLTPIGSVVELETGEWAVVIGPSARADAHDRPRVRVVMDRRGNVLEPPQEVDLGQPPAGQVLPQIARIVEPAEARFNVAKVFVG